MAEPNSSAPTAPVQDTLTRWAPWIVLAGVVLAYANSFGGVFLLDDGPSILENLSLRSWATALHPPSDAGVGARPLLNLSFALNYLLGGENPAGYHALNLLIHAVAALLVFAVARRAFVLLGVADACASVRLALFSAVLWALNPIQTEAVTYISQRAESGMGVCYLAAAYFFLRAQTSTRPQLELAASIVACYAGVLVKETIASAPLAILVFDGMFVARGWRGLRQRAWYHAATHGIWILVLLSARTLAERGADVAGQVTWWQYALLSCKSMAIYLRLCIWPAPLVFDYGMAVAPTWRQVIVGAVLVTALLGGVAWGLKRRSRLAFLGLWFLLLLAPTTSVIAIPTQPTAESRLYLPLMAAMVVVVLSVRRFVPRLQAVVLAALACGFAALTIARNEDYRSELAIWAGSVAHVPASARAHANVAVALLRTDGDRAVARRELETALRLDPGYAAANCNLGQLLLEMGGDRARAIELLRKAVQASPKYKEAHTNLGIALAEEGRFAEALPHFDAAIALDPYSTAYYFNRGLTLRQLPGRLEDAKRDFLRAAELDPEFEGPRRALQQLRSPPEAAGAGVQKP